MARMSSVSKSVTAQRPRRTSRLASSAGVRRDRAAIEVPEIGGANDRPARDHAVEAKRGTTLDGLIREMIRAEVRTAVERSIDATPSLLTYVSAAEYAMARSISISTVRNAVRSGVLPAIRIGAAVRVRADVEIGVPIVVRSSRRPASPAARAEAILGARTKRAVGRAEGRRAA